MSIQQIPYTGKTVRLCPPTEPLAQVEPIEPPYLVYALLIIGGVALGWVSRAAFLPLDHYQLAWLIPLVTFLVAWGNKHDA